MNLIKKNKDGSAYYLWKAYQRLEGGSVQLLDGDDLPIDPDMVDNMLNGDYINSFNFDGDLFDHSGCIEIYLKFSPIENSVNLSLEEIRLYVPPKEVIEMQKDRFSSVNEEIDFFGLFDQAYEKFKYQFLEISSTSSINSKNGLLAIYNSNDEEIKSIVDNVEIKSYGKKLKQNIKRHNQQIEDILKIIPHFDEITEPYEHISYDESEEHGFGIKWKKGEYNISQIYAHQKTQIFSKIEIDIHLPCCNKVVDYEKGEFYSRWGVNYLRCSNCDTNHPVSKNDNNFNKKFYKLKDGSDIDFSWQGIADVCYPDTISFYGWIIKPTTKLDKKLKSETVDKYIEEKYKLSSHKKYRENFDKYKFKFMFIN
jgi:hypothetical protein